MGIMAKESIRRKHWEVFMIAHHVAFPMVLIVVLYHAASAWYFIGGGIILWIVDNVLRFQHGTSLVAGTFPASPGAVCRLPRAVWHEHYRRARVPLHPPA